MGKPFDLEIPHLKIYPMEIIREVYKSICTRGFTGVLFIWAKLRSNLYVQDELNSVYLSMKNQAVIQNDSGEIYLLTIQIHILGEK